MGRIIDFPWKLRLSHEGRAAIRVERPGRCLRFDPFDGPDATPLLDDDIVILTWTWPEHRDAVAARVLAGARPTVVAEPELLAWLANKGPVDAHRSPAPLDGMQIETLPYTPIPYATPIEAVRKAGAALSRPVRAAGRLLSKVGGPRAAPVIVQVTFPNGERLLHLNLSLHSSTPAAWLDDAAARFAGAETVIVGVDYEEDEAVLRQLPRFAPGRVLFTDLLGETRRAVGLPTGLLTPACDEAINRGMDAYLFVSGAGMRFE